MSEQVNPEFSHQYWMQHALKLADRAAAIGEVPVGAVLVSNDNRILGEGWNQSILSNDPSAHAEMQAIRQAAERIGNYRLVNTRLYVTLEPCPMCAGVLVHSRVSQLIYGAADYKTGCAGSVMNLVQHEQLNHQLEVVSGVLADVCSQRISAFFQQRRSVKKALKKMRKNSGEGNDNREVK